MSTLLDAVHGGVVYTRRVARLATLIAERIPPNATVLDVGTGDGALAARVQRLRADVSVTGVDVLTRPHTAIPVLIFDGTHLPFPSASVDAVTCIDVLHHAADATQLLRECARVARDMVIVKDHLREGVLAATTLRFMDWVGNARHGVRLPYHYLSRHEWHEMLSAIDARVKRWDESLQLYPIPMDWVFGRRLHVLMTLQPSSVPATGPRG